MNYLQLESWGFLVKIILSLFMNFIILYRRDSNNGHGCEIQTQGSVESMEFFVPSGHKKLKLWQALNGWYYVNKIKRQLFFFFNECSYNYIKQSHTSKHQIHFICDRLKLLYYITANKYDVVGCDSRNQCYQRIISTSLFTKREFSACLCGVLTNTRYINLLLKKSSYLAT